MLSKKTESSLLRLLWKKVPRERNSDDIRTERYNPNILCFFLSTLDLYHQKREESSSPSSSSGRSPERDVYLLAVLSLSTFLVLFVIVLLVLLRRRTRHRKSHPPGFIDSRGEDGHSIHLLLQQQQSMHGPSSGMQPDLIRAGNAASNSGGDKMQLISRLNNFDSNIVEHLVIRNEHLMSNQATLEKQSGSQHLKNSIPGSAIVMNNNRKTGSCASVNALVTPLHQRQQQHHHQQQHGMMMASPANTNEEQNSSVGSFSEAGSEPDYAEPVITSSGSSFATPERRPPLPKTSPPNPRQAFATLTCQVGVLQPKQICEVPPSKTGHQLPTRSRNNRPSRTSNNNRCQQHSPPDSSSLSS